MSAEEVRDDAEMEYYGTSEKVRLPLDAFVVMPQIRAGVNPELPALVESIRARKLINTVDVACLTLDEMREYARFVDQTWDTIIPPESIYARQQTNGMFYLLVAGHTRYEAIRILQAERPDKPIGIEANLRDLHTPAQIIAHQMDENIHSTPSDERRAIAVVELYNFELGSGLCASRAQFLAKYKGQISRKVLSEALGFHDLPHSARDFVFAKRVPYGAGVALGQAAPIIQAYVINRLGINPVDVDYYEGPFAEAYRQEVGNMLAYIESRGLNNPAARKYVAGQVAAMKEELELRERAAKSGLAAMTLEFKFVSAEEQAAQYIHQLRGKYRAALREMSLRSIESVQTSIRLHAALMGPDAAAELLDERDKRVKALGQAVLPDAPQLFGA